MDKQVQENKEESLFLDRWFSKIENIATGAVAITCFLILFWIVGSVFSRSFFNYPLQGVYELVALLMIPVAFLPLSYTQRFREHIRIDFLISRLSGRAYSVLETIIMVLCLIVFSIVLPQIIKHAIGLWEVGENDPGAFDVPIWPFYFFAVFGVILLMVRFLIDAIQSIQKLFKA